MFERLCRGVSTAGTLWRQGRRRWWRTASLYARNLLCREPFGPLGNKAAATWPRSEPAGRRRRTVLGWRLRVLGQRADTPQHGVGGWHVAGRLGDVAVHNGGSAGGNCGITSGQLITATVHFSHIWRHNDVLSLSRWLHNCVNRCQSLTTDLVYQSSSQREK